MPQFPELNMNCTRSVRAKAARFIGRMFALAILACVAGLDCEAAQATVPVDQSPLIIQRPLPPDIVLMLDDSGSMSWDFMPDICYLNGVDCNNGTINYDALIDSSNNGVYYDPTITYTPPPYADGTRFADATSLVSARINGFQSSTAVDLTKYNGGYDTGYVEYSSSAVFAAQVPTSNTATYNNVSRSQCDRYYAAQAGATNESFKVTRSNGNGVCTITYTTNVTKNKTFYYFQYSTGPAAGPYVLHYVADTDCAGQPNCVLASDTSGQAAPAGVQAGQNIANWFQYYHTRMLMAKSGLFSSFSGINPEFRMGFGSINGNNNGGLPANTSSYNSVIVAHVSPFGDGSAGTQKAAFWSWLTNEVPNGGTPLQSAVDAVGQYYTTQQPWQTSETDVGELACRQAYTIVTTDGFWNGSFNNGPGNADNTAGSTISGPNGQSYTYRPIAPYKDGISNTLADVAMKYWKMDLRPGTANEVPPSTEDPAFWQHMSTFTLGLGFTPVGIQPAGTTVDQVFSWANGGAPISGFSWPTPSPDSIYNIADLAHAAVNGHGGFYSATSPQAFASGLKDALKRAAERVGTGASLAANSTSLDTGTVAYQANYYTAKWKGDLKALAVDPNTGNVSTTPNWTAAAQLPAAANRIIYTFVPGKTSGQTGTTVVFKNSGSGTSLTPPALSAAELAALGSSSADQAKMVDYLRGDAAQEQKNGGGLRNRDTPLGDIVDSQPVYGGPPDPNQFYGQSFSGSTDFAQYASDNSARSAKVYVAANDGMLHAFDASTGAETYAYLPGAVILNGLKQLADPGYGTNIPHQYFNDGELTIGDAYFSSAWHTVLVGTTGRGTAQAVYALDITDPANIKLLWERSAGDGKSGSNYIGQMTGKPVIAQVDDGSWSVLLGNGYNSAAGVSALLQFDLSTGALSVHTTSDTTGDNGLAAPAAWMNVPGNGISTVAYAGDLHGQVWSFQLNDGTRSTPTSTGSLLFTARSASNALQPITAGLLAGKDPATGNVWVFFGTGRYFAAGDLTDTSTQTWYGLIVQSADASLPSNLSQGRAALKQRMIVAETSGDATATPPILPARVVTPAPSAPDMSGLSGWYMDLLSPTGPSGSTAEGERMVTPNQFQGSLLLGVTRIPQAVDVCNPSGRGWIMAVDPFTGTNPSASFFDLNGNGQLGSDDTVTVNGKSYPAAGVGFSSLPNNPIFVGGSMLVSFDNGSTSSIHTTNTTGSTRRVSWRELISP